MAPGKHPDVEKAVVMVRFPSPPQPCMLPRCTPGFWSDEWLPTLRYPTAWCHVDAWQWCGQPNGQKGIQNIRKRGLQMRKLKAAAASLGCCSAERLEGLEQEAAVTRRRVMAEAMRFKQGGARPRDFASPLLK